MGPLEGCEENPLQVGRVWGLEGRAEEASEELGLFPGGEGKKVGALTPQVSCFEN